MHVRVPVCTYYSFVASLLDHDVRNTRGPSVSGVRINLFVLGWVAKGLQWL